MAAKRSSSRKKAARRPVSTDSVVRQTISLPPEDHALFVQLVDRAQRAGIYQLPLSAVARVALRVLAGLTDKELVEALRSTPPVRAGRKPRATT